MSHFGVGTSGPAVKKTKMAEPLNPKVEPEAATDSPGKVT